jgi:hypothetical protein
VRPHACDAAVHNAQLTNVKTFGKKGKHGEAEQQARKVVAESMAVADVNKAMGDSLVHLLQVSTQLQLLEVSLSPGMALAQRLCEVRRGSRRSFGVALGTEMGPLESVFLTRNMGHRKRVSTRHKLPEIHHPLAYLVRPPAHSLS